MEIYLVGGAIRDQFLGLPVRERDWVVVGATPQDLLSQHFTPVGKDFPVFLHPVTKEEYALARTERKSGKGYTGFSVNADPSVTLEQDLQRRDLTINAMAQTSTGVVMDPFCGQEDLKNKLLRHVSSAFTEDPVRVLRVARLMARLGPLGFTVATNTLQLMRKMAESGELQHLVPERVWKEWSRALVEKAPHFFIQTLRESGALNLLFPEIETPLYTEKLLIAATYKTEDPLIRFAVMLSDLSPLSITLLCERYKIPKSFSKLALLVAKHSARCRCIENAPAEIILNLFKQLDVFRKPERFAHFLLACHIVMSLEAEDAASITLDFLTKVHAACQAVKTTALVQSGVGGVALGKAIDAERLEIIRNHCYRICHPRVR